MERTEEEVGAMLRDFSAQLSLARESTEKSLRDVSRASGVSRAGIARMEAGDRVPSLRSLVGLSMALPVRFVVEGGVARIVILEPAP